MEAQEGLLSMSGSLTALLGPECSNNSSCAIGAFDGIHLGHQHILRNTVAYARQEGLDSYAVLFDPLPSQFFGRLGMDQRILLPDEQKEMLEHLGITKTLILPFTAEIADLPAESFLERMQSVLHCRKLFMGEDFSLGKGRTADPAVITKLGEKLNYKTEVIPKDIMDGEVISSTRIRSLLNSGRVEEANRLLGYPFFFSGETIHGAARGRKLGFPTLNISIPPEKTRLPNGVYAVNVLVDGQKYASVTNIGVRPTFETDDRGTLAEAFLLNAAGDFYGKTIRLEFIKMLREEIRFPSAEALKEQISRDIRNAEELLSQYNR